MGSDDKVESIFSLLDDSDAISNMEKDGTVQHVSDGSDSDSNKMKKGGYSTDDVSSSSSDSGCELIYDPNHLNASNFPRGVDVAQVRAFFGFDDDDNDVQVATFEEKTREGEYFNTHAAIIFESEEDKQKIRALSRKPFGVGGPSILVRPQGTDWTIIHVSGFSNVLPSSEMKVVLGNSFGPRGEILNIFLPLDAQTGSTLGFGYILLDIKGKDQNTLCAPIKIDGFIIKVRKANLKKLFTAEMAGDDDSMIQDKKTALKKTLLPVAKLEKPLFGLTAMKFTWREKRADLIREARVQDGNDCWTVPLVSSYEALMTLKGKERKPLTSKFLKEAVDPSSIVSGRGIDKLKDVIEVMKSGFVEDMIIHHRPRGGDKSDHEAFEDKIISLLHKAPLMVAVEVLEPFDIFRGNDIYCPSEMETHERTFENPPFHCLLLTGHGIYQGLDHWELQESFGPEYGDDNGFIKMVRHMCLIKQVVELRV